ncbi:MAG: hypothetical protein A2586_00025 [Candidatus Harrisonbacteria bacterium RIFOXYD1_FULL_40_9]|uniref:Methyltransferase type 11 domain-containing protein n=1 Tax=Candidatus Harrisonbacteria bacterium RIFOXYD1_FULL_40_9 TaxID=1798412 RepID=A0A1G1ZYQ0_9BACT|nr:MAG: hypothetical protein A2586_00025 [Candidatus Harrisonbacteria bacterium RIFOXYD1_FULL_40_9]
MKTFFDVIAPIYEIVHSGAKHTFNNIENLAQFRKEDIVVDVGGGTGRIAQFLVGKVKMITVIDSSEPMIAECKKHSGIMCIQASGDAMPIKEDSVDKVILVDVFHHLRSPENVIQEIKRILKVDGTLIIEEFNPRTWGGRFIMLVEKVLRLGSTFHLPSDLNDIFLRHEFVCKVYESHKKSYYLVAKKVR